MPAVGKGRFLTRRCRLAVLLWPWVVGPAVEGRALDDRAMIDDRAMMDDRCGDAVDRWEGGWC